MTDLLRLKTRLKLKRLRRLTDWYVEENLGYCPSNDEHFDKLMEEMRTWADIARKHYNDLYIEHIK